MARVQAKQQAEEAEKMARQRRAEARMKKEEDERERREKHPRAHDLGHRISIGVNACHLPPEVYKPRRYRPLEVTITKPQTDTMRRVSSQLFIVVLPRASHNACKYLEL